MSSEAAVIGYSFIPGLEVGGWRECAQSYSFNNNLKTEQLFSQLMHI